MLERRPTWASAADLGVRPTTLERLFEMDYIIAGIASILLFVYLIYALLKPERF